MNIYVNHCSAILSLFAASLCVACKLSGADLKQLDKGRHVHLARMGHGPLCDAKVQNSSAESVALRLLKTTSECGQKGELIRITKDEVADLIPEERLTKGRVVAKVFLSAGSVVALSAIPLTSSDPESWLILANGALPGFVAYKMWKAVPRRRDYLVVVTCPDGLHCFSDWNRLLK